MPTLRDDIKLVCDTLQREHYYKKKLDTNEDKLALYKCPACEAATRLLHELEVDELSEYMQTHYIKTNADCNCEDCEYYKRT